MRIEFEFGKVLPAEDPVAQWIVKLAMIHNDLVFANNSLRAANEQSVEWFYWYRYAIAHYHEAMNLLAEEQSIEEIATFVASLSESARKLHDAALEIHKDVAGPTSRVRNETTFHYPGEQTKKTLTAALKNVADHTAVVESGDSNKVKDTRFSYADDVVATLFYRAMGADDAEMAKITARIAEGEKNLMQFINHAQDEFFIRAEVLDG